MSLYDDLGGAAAISAAVDVFYQKVLADPSLVGFFDGLDMDRQKKMLGSFLTFAFGGPNNYSGRGMRVAHAKSVADGLNEAHFDAVVGHLGATLTELGVNDEKIAEATAVANSIKDDVLNR